jgi:hypothetical protein
VEDCWVHLVVDGNFCTLSVNSLAYPAHARDNPAACTLLGG